jgi:hypothetical protein
MKTATAWSSSTSGARTSNPELAVHRPTTPCRHAMLGALRRPGSHPRASQEQEHYCLNQALYSKTHNNRQCSPSPDRNSSRSVLMPSIPQLSRYRPQNISPAALQLDWIVPAVLLLSSVFAYTNTAPRHGLLTSAVAWASICVLTALVGAGIKGVLDARPAQRCAWAAGALIALAGIEERSVGSGGRAIWWAKVDIHSDEDVGTLTETFRCVRLCFR